MQPGGWQNARNVPFFFCFLKIKQTLSAKAGLMNFLFVLITSEVAIWNKAGRFFMETGRSTLNTLLSVCEFCCRCDWCGPNKDPRAAKSAWRETNFGKFCLIFEDRSARLN